MSKNERFEDVIYAVEFYLPSEKSWHRLLSRNDFESAKLGVQAHERNDLEYFGKKMDYRIVKLTIKKEVVG